MEILNYKRERGKPLSFYKWVKCIETDSVVNRKIRIIIHYPQQTDDIVDKIYNDACEEGYYYIYVDNEKEILETFIPNPDGDVTAGEIIDFFYNAFQTYYNITPTLIEVYKGINLIPVIIIGSMIIISGIYIAMKK